MNNDNQHIPSGYKPSPLGIIPEDWEVKRLGKIANRIGDGIHGTPIYIDKSDYYFINGNNLNDGKIVINDSTKCVPYSEYIKYKKELSKNTILLSINGTIGNIALYNDEKVMLGKSVAYITISNYKFFYHLLQSTQVLTAFEKELTGSTIRNLSLDSIRNLAIALPSQKEMEKIGAVLDLWDTAIAKQTALIERLTLRKRGLMQQLLSGKKRLKGFEGEWKRVKFKEIFQRKTQTVDDGSSIQVLSVTKEGIVSQKEYFNKEIASDDTSKYLLVEKGDLAMSGLNFWMGSCHILTQYEKGIISPAYKVFSIRNGFSIEYIVNFVQGHNFKSSLLGSSVIGASIVRRNLDLEMLEEWTYLFPSLPEQQAISNILTRADKEIEIQKQKLAAMQEQKKGLMQVLLTGKRRVK